LLTVGKTVDEAAWWFISMERCCQAQILAESVGKPKLIDEKTTEETHKLVGFNPWDRMNDINRSPRCPSKIFA
jgi:ribulose-5-phosphate 4-epimerase/fuculose-1-phosphate aldolase